MTTKYIIQNKTLIIIGKGSDYTRLGWNEQMVDHAKGGQDFSQVCIIA